MSMSLEELRAFGRRWLDDFFNAQDMDMIDEMYSPEYKRYDGHMEVDREIFRDMNRAFFHAFPDLAYSPIHIMADGDLVCIRWEGEGTFVNDLDWRGKLFPATNRPITVRGTDTLRVVDGKTVESWSSVDMAGMFSQIVPEIGELFAKVFE